jgi:hypothetical protein
MGLLAAFVTGTALSALAAGLLGSLGPATTLPHLNRSPQADYRALSGAAGLGPWMTFALASVIFTVCFLLALWQREHERANRSNEETEMQS